MIPSALITVELFEMKIPLAGIVFTFDMKRPVYYALILLGNHFHMSF